MGDTSPTLDQTARSIDVNDPDSPVLFLGVKENHKDYLLAGDVFLLTSREDYSSLAGMEAFECGSPVICFQGVGDLCTLMTPDIGVVVDFEDTKAMAEALVDLLSDRSGGRAA